MNLEAVLQDLIERHRVLQDTFIVYRIHRKGGESLDTFLVNLRRIIKKSDFVLEESPGTVVVIFPHTPKHFESRIRERLISVLGDRISSIETRIYPDDGETPADLLRAGGEGGQGQTPGQMEETTAWDAYFSGPLKGIERALDQIMSGQPLAIGIHGHAWCRPDALVERILRLAKLKKIQIVDVSVEEEKDITFPFWLNLLLPILAHGAREPSLKALLEVAREHTILLYVKDPTRLPSEALTFLRSLLTGSLQARLGVIYEVVSTGNPPPQGLVRWEDSLRRSGRHLPIPLHPMPLSDVLHLATNLLRLPLDADQITHLHTLSGGYPDLLFALFRHPDQWSRRLLQPLHPELMSRLEPVVESLPAALRQFLISLSVLGPTFQVEEVRQLFSREDPGKVIRFLDTVRDRGWLRKEGDSWAYHPPVVWKYCYHALDGTQRRRFHRHMFSLLENQVFMAGTPELYWKLAWHAWGMEDPTTAFKYVNQSIASSPPEKQLERVRWVPDLMDDFVNHPQTSPSALQDTVQQALQVLLAYGDAEALRIAQRARDFFSRLDTRQPQGISQWLETRVYLGDWEGIEDAFSEARSSALSPDQQIRLDLLQGFYEVLDGNLRQARQRIGKAHQELVSLATQSPASIPLSLSQLLAQAFMLQALASFWEGDPLERVQKLIQQSTRQVSPEGFLHLIHNELLLARDFWTGKWEELLARGQPRGYQELMYASLIRFFRGQWDAELQEMLQELSRQPSRFGLIGRRIRTWVNSFVRGEAPVSGWLPFRPFGVLSLWFLWNWEREHGTVEDTRRVVEQLQQTDADVLQHPLLQALSLQNDGTEAEWVSLASCVRPYPLLLLLTFWAYPPTQPLPENLREELLSAAQTLQSPWLEHLVRFRHSPNREEQHRAHQMLQDLAARWEA